MGSKSPNLRALLLRRVGDLRIHNSRQDLTLKGWLEFVLFVQYFIHTTREDFGDVISLSMLIDRRKTFQILNWLHAKLSSHKVCTMTIPSLVNIVKYQRDWGIFTGFSKTMSKVRHLWNQMFVYLHKNIQFLSIFSHKITIISGK